MVDLRFSLFRALVGTIFFYCMQCNGVVLDVDWAERHEATTMLDPFDSGLLGDNIHPMTGGLSFSALDVSIPGNSALEVSVRRRTDPSQARGNDMANWRLEFPVISTKILERENKHWGKKRCSERGSSLPNYFFHNSGSYLYPHDYSSGIILKIPGQGDQQIVDRSIPGLPVNAQGTTVNNWYFTCLNNIDGQGTEGFLAHAPNGDVYRFDKLMKRRNVSQRYVWSHEAVATGHVISGPSSAQTGLGLVSEFQRFTVEMVAATKVTDVNGNYVDYTYDSDGLLTRIRANDGRRIDFKYTSTQLVSEAIVNVNTSGERIWRYTYAGENAFVYDQHNVEGSHKWQSFSNLDTVTLPDGNYWDYDLGALAVRAVPGISFKTPKGKSRKCIQKDQIVKVKHPNGMLGEFLLKEQIMRIAPAGPFNGTPCPGSILGSSWGGVTDMMSVARKVLSGQNVPTQQWIYKYDIPGVAGDTVTNVTRPDSSVQRYTHYNPFQYGNERRNGKLKSLETFESGIATAPIEIQSYSYELGLRGGCPRGVAPSLCFPIIETQLVIERDGDTFTTQKEYDTDPASPGYSFDKPIEIRSWSNVTEDLRRAHTARRLTAITYAHNKIEWILGLPDVVTQNGRELYDYNYDSLGQLTEEKHFTHTFATYSYYRNGTVNWVKDALGRKTEARYWKRGKPQHVIFDDGTNFHQTVNTNGWVMNFTDPKGYITGYDYDVMGRLILVDPVGTSWDSTFINYDFSDFGVVQTITKGDSKTTTTYDAMFRPVLEQQKAVDTGWSSFVNKQYDAMGRLVFKSQPSSSATELKGIDYEYDVLGRIYEKTENVEPYAKTKYRYLRGHRKRVFDPSNAYTDYYSYGYDGPNDSNIRKIISYSNTDALLQKTYLFKNVHGQLQHVRQWGSDNNYLVDKKQYYYYDNRQRLCRHYAEETGATLYEYNDAGELVAYAKGQSDSGCGTVPSSAAKVSLGYDLLGRLLTTHFSDPTTPNITREYDKNGNLTLLQRGNHHWRYSYLNNNKLWLQTLNIDNKSFNLLNFYNSSGYIEGKGFKFQDTKFKINNNLNGLGHLLGVDIGGTQQLVTDINYHPSGQVHTMALGNGQQFAQQLNDRLLPEHVLTLNGSQKALDQSMEYDSRGFVTSIIDGAVSSNNRVLGYDGLARLITASGPWGNGGYIYDSLGNMRFKKLGSRTVNLAYNNKNQLVQSVDTGSSGTRTLAYDSRGNVTRLGGLNFSYDYSDQPVQVSGDADGHYLYDGNLKRVKAVVNGEETYNVYGLDGSLAYVHNVTTGAETVYIPGPRGIIARLTNGEVTYLHNDYLGSAQSGTNSAGNVVWRERYTPYGESLVDNAANDDLAGFTGHIKDKATELNYMQARYYDPIIGRFLSNDPVGAWAHLDQGNLQGFNRYAYANNDPVNLIDPDGKIAQFVVPIVALACSATKCQQAIAESAGAVMEMASGGAKANSRAKRRAARAAQRLKKNPRVATSQSGKNMQGSKYGEDNLRGQEKVGMDGKTKVGVQDGSKDSSNNETDHKPAIDVGNMKAGEQPGRNGQPRIGNDGKVKAEIKVEEPKVGT